MKINELFTLISVEKEREVGIEVEMEGKGLEAVHPNYWAVYDDGSLRGGQAEYVLKAPVKRNLFESRIDYLYKILRSQADIEPSDRCGVHIHINCQWNTIEETFNFIILYLMFEDLLVHWCGEDREGNLFCLRAQDAEYLIMSLIEDRERGAFHSCIDSGRYKYAALNTSSLRKYGSLEFRSLRTPDYPDQIKTWVHILLRLKDKAIKSNDPKDLIRHCSHRGEVDFAKEIFGKYFKTLQCPEMDFMIMDGVRRVQALAFTPLGKMKKGTKNPAPQWRNLAGQHFDFNIEPPPEEPPEAEEAE